jgi:hypothetical protein
VQTARTAMALQVECDGRRAENETHGNDGGGDDFCHGSAPRKLAPQRRAVDAYDHSEKLL